MAWDMWDMFVDMLECGIAAALCNSATEGGRREEEGGGGGGWKKSAPFQTGMGYPHVDLECSFQHCGSYHSKKTVLSFHSLDSFLLLHSGASRHVCVICTRR